MRSKRDIPVIYWDTCVFFAWIKQETCWSEEIMKGIEQTVEQVYKKEIVLMTSVVTLTEVLQSKMTPEQKERYKNVFGHPHLQLMDVDRRISEKAALIREFYDTRVIDPSGAPTGGSVMSLGDAFHLATAIHYEVDAFQTIDGAGRRKRRTDLLKLNGDVAGIRLVIVQPKYIPPLEHLEGPPGPTVSGAQLDLPLDETASSGAAPTDQATVDQATAEWESEGGAAREPEAESVVPVTKKEGIPDAPDETS